MRRVPFNLIVGLTGLLTCSLTLGIALLSERIVTQPPGGGGGSPLLVLIGIFLYGLSANICYTSGWIAELVARSVWKQKALHFGEIAFALGLIFSILLTLLPAAVCLITATVSILKSHP
jgi:hypothetical protein